MNKKSKEIFSFIGKWLLIRLHWVLPSAYLFLNLLFGRKITLLGLILCLLIGSVSAVIVRDWKKEKSFHFEKKELPDDESLKERIRCFFKGLFGSVINSGVLFWIIVMSFLGLTTYVMHEGLDFLFYESEKKQVFIWAFTLTVSVTLFWLIVKISQREKVLFFMAFYLIFDLLSAFSFNYIHFYDNVSQVQSMDRDISFCRTYLNIRTPLFGKLKNVTDTVKLSSQIKDLDLLSANESQKMESIENKKDTVNQYHPSYNRELREIKKSKSKHDKEIEKLRANLNVKKGMMSQYQQLEECRSSLDSLCNKYAKDKENFTLEELSQAKQHVANIEAISVSLSDSAQISHYNDTIDWIIKKRIQKSQDDRYASISILFENIQTLFWHNNVRNEAEEIECESEFAREYNLEESQFEKRVFIQSISLSILIDIAPLVLGLFVAFLPKKSNDG